MEKKHKGLQIVLLSFACAIVLVFCVFGLYLYREVNSGLFFEKTTLNGYDISGMTCAEVYIMLESEYSAPVLTVTEDGTEQLSLTLDEMGYTIDEAALLSDVEDCMHEQNMNLLSSLSDGNDYEIKVIFDYDDDVFTQAVSSENFVTDRIKSENAAMEFDGTEYYIQPEVCGTEFDDADLQVLIRDYVDKLVVQDEPQDDVSIELPESFYYLPEITQENTDMNTLMDIYNSYCQSVITYTFGEETVTLDWSDLKDWIIIDGDSAAIDEQKVYDFVVYTLAATYNTLYLPRTFKTSNGKKITFESSDYGYQIDQSAEIEQLMADIASNTEVTREPVYSSKGLRREGTDDVCGTYVEVDLTAQHLWYYKEGELIVETDIVSGKPTEDRETITGVFTIPYKQTDVVLSGGSGSGAWSTPVTYWMPFYEGQGLHDASWRKSFGGSIYKTDGSHGCINMPYEAAETVYNEMEERTPIFLYKTK